MLALLFALSLTAHAAEVPDGAFYMLVGATDAQLANCPSPVRVKKGTFKTGEFLKAVYPSDKIAAEPSKGDVYTFTAGARTVTIKVNSVSEFEWNEKGEGKLCKKAKYATNEANQEQLDSMIPDEEVDEKSDAKETKGPAPAPKAGVKHPVKKGKK